MPSVGDQTTEEEEYDHSQGTGKSCDNKDFNPNESELDSEAELMKSMGLPLQFGGVSAYKNFELFI
jgi:trimethylguanosine synthase